MATSSNYFEDRRSPRWPLAIKATMGGGGFFKVAVQLVDVSEDGCRIKVASRMAKGVFMTLKIGELPAMRVKVVWSDGRYAGLSFCAPLGGAALESVVRSGNGSGDGRAGAVARVPVGYGD